MTPVSAPILDGMPRRLYSATPTRLTTWLDCPRRYRFAYLDRPAPPKRPPWAHNTVGGAIHNVLAAWWRLDRDARTVAVVPSLVDEYWGDEGFRDEAQSQQWRERAAAMVQRYVAELDPDDEPRGIERTVGTVHGHTALTGRVDRIDERDGELVIVDYKTGRHVLTTDDARSSLALAVYAAAAARTLRVSCHRVELHHLPTGEVVTWHHDERTLARHLDRADEVAAECRSADAAFRDGDTGDTTFPPRPSPLCGWCDYIQHCPDGRANAGVRSSWAGLADS